MATADAPVSSEPQCGGGISNKRRIISLEESDGKQWEMLERLRNRPPVWASLLIAVLAGIIGYLAR